jgi:hypothetical protein
VTQTRRESKVSFFSFFRIIHILTTIYSYIHHERHHWRKQPAQMETRLTREHRLVTQMRRESKVSFFSFSRIIHILTTIYSYIHHERHHWRTQPAQMETRGHRLVTQTRRESKVCFFSFVSYYTYTNYYLQLHTPRTTTQPAQMETRGHRLMTQTRRESKVRFLSFVLYYICTNYYLQLHSPHMSWYDTTEGIRRIQPAQRETQGQGLVTQTRREPQVHFFTVM